jgi:hypothetical protein
LLKDLAQVYETSNRGMPPPTTYQNGQVDFPMQFSNAHRTQELQKPKIYEPENINRYKPV